MAIRTTVRDVRDLITVNVEDNVIEHNFIFTANLLVDTHLLDSGYSANVLTEIEKYLAAHFTALAAERGGLTRDAMTGAEAEYSDIYSSGFNSTRFGQVALTLDYQGTLASISSTKPKAQFRTA